MRTGKEMSKVTVRLNYTMEQQTWGTTTYKIFTLSEDTTEDYLTYDDAVLYAAAGVMYAQVLSFAGEVDEVIPTSPIEGEIVVTFNLLYHSTEWWIVVGES